MNRLFATGFICALAFCYSCGNSNKQEDKLPILGEREPIERNENGKIIIDTLYHQIPPFSFTNQDSQQVTHETLEGKVYVADFFFTSCPTICPKMKSQLLRIHEQYKDNPNVAILSHSIAPTHDTVPVLQDYAERLGVANSNWHFITGDKDSIYNIAKSYMVTAMEDEKEVGGFVHSGAFLLVDENRHIRGIYDGTDPAAVDKLLQDIPVLLQEN